METSDKSAEKPIGLAIVICERVITEKGTNNKTLVSIFNNINALEFPCRHDRLSLYIALTNSSGRKTIKVIMKRDTDAVVEVSGEVFFKDQTQVVDLIFNLRDIVFIQPGPHSFEVFADDDYIFESRFNVMQIDPKSRQSD